MWKDRLLSGVVLCAGGLFATAALADPQTGSEKAAGAAAHGMEKQAPQFSELDTNRDGYLSESEMQQAGQLSVEHATLDMDNDGRVDRSEFAALERIQPGAPASSASKSAGQPAEDRDY